MCGPHRRFAPLLPRTLRRIPQAVGAVATFGFMAWASACDWLVSIPQAVSAVATNLVSDGLAKNNSVSIPQAVSAVATYRGRLLQ